MHIHVNSASTSLVYTLLSVVVYPYIVDTSKTTFNCKCPDQYVKDAAGMFRFRKNLRNLTDET